MARIRTIKPEFFTSADIVELTPLSRLLYISLWCEADREGRLSWNVKTLKMRYLPADDCSVEELSSELVNQGLIKIYEVDGKNYAAIPSFKSHQVINNREKNSEIPSCTDATLTRESAVKAEGRKEGKGKEGKGREGKEEGGDKSQDEFSFIGDVIKLKHPDFEKWKKAYYAIPDLNAELLAADAWYRENPPKGGKWFFPVSNWLKKAHNEANEKNKPENDPMYGVMGSCQE